MSEIEDAKPGLNPCPTCHLLDKVVNVTVARAPAFTETKPAAGDEQSSPASGDLMLPITLRTTFDSSPDSEGASCGLLIMAFLALIPTGILYGVYASTSSHATGRFPLWPTFIPGVIAALFLVGSVVAGVQGVSAAKAKEAADEIARRGWYCARCGCAYFQPNTAPTGALAGHAYTPAEFRKIMFKEGEYGGERGELA